MFVDELELVVRGGRGGNGVISFRREKYVPRGGPDGGDGGRGGSVYLWADPSKHSFLDLRYRRLLKAADGGHGRNKNRHGAAGADLHVPVPPGTVIRSATGDILADLALPAQKALVAAGGKGGSGNARFTSSRRRAPRLAEKGLPGEERSLKLELKLVAQVGMVGFPNAGKSTLLGKISAARPKTGSYPFTTLQPALGVVRVGDEGTFTVADLPGLIEGAHRGEGLGHRFLRHVERNLILLFIIDVSPQAVPSPAVAYDLLAGELRKYDSRLVNYPRVVAANKVDLPGAAEGLASLSRVLDGEKDKVPLLPLSALTGEGTAALREELFRALQDLYSAGDSDNEVQEQVYQPLPREERPLRVEVKAGLYHVSGTAVERFAAKTDFNSEEALRRFQAYCRRSGVEKALRDSGVGEGDTVRIGDEEFIYYP